ncbi:MAG TPA: DUF92 domain-containing protein [Silvibacterium sp.]|nr:DUF92 domain-containing protein [Silvibacterium sp.]
MTLKDRSVTHLRWQSQIPLFLTAAVGATAIVFKCFDISATNLGEIEQAIGIGTSLAVLTWKVRAATLGAALTGGLCATALYLATPGWWTALWPLLALLLLTLAATRYGRARKQRLGLAESARGRTAPQVAANLGAAVLASFPLKFAEFPCGLWVISTGAIHMAIAAALAEAAADTLSSELGEVLGGEPRMLTHFWRVPIGTDGAISVAGTAAGCAAALIVSAVASVALGIVAGDAALVALAAIIGLFTDSLLGAVLENRGLLNNDAVNFLSTIVAAIVAVAFSTS